MSMASSLTPRELETLREYALHGDYISTAEAMHLSVQTVKNYLYLAYSKLEVHGAIDAFRAIGWLLVPEPGEATVQALEHEAAETTRRLLQLRARIDDALAEQGHEAVA